MKKVLIDVRDDIYNTCVSEYHNGTPFLAETVIARGKVLSDMTNGDTIKAMFPNELLTSITSTLWWGDNMSFNKDWWNAPYKKGESK